MSPARARAEPPHLITTPTGEQVPIPETPAADCSPSVPHGAADRIRETYEREGCVVVRGLIPRALLEEASLAFDEEVLPHEGFIYRQASARPERHVFDDHGYMLNSLLNIQDMRREFFGRFRQRGLDVITHARMRSAVQAILGEPGKIVMSMFFEGNPATWAHQDTYYLDSEPLGNMVGAWVAVEDIAPGAGRFYVYPGSHRIEAPLNSGELGIATDHGRYKRLVLDLIREHELEIRVPALAAGDVVFWNSRTIHGSLETTQPVRSRRSFTAHYTPESSGFLQFQARRRKLRMRDVDGMQVIHQKDQERLHERLILQLYGRFPNLVGGIRDRLVRLVTS